jgi:NAD(P)-dependent dehydrogenase (short-subunit alcohol dehydrogenase family)
MKKTVVITGAAGHLGRAATRAFGEAGYRRILVDLDELALRSAYPEAGEDIVFVGADLVDENASEMLRAAVDGVQGAQVLCNIAGAFHYGAPVHETTTDVWHRLLDLNALTLMHAAGAVVPSMQRARSGVVINIGAAGHLGGKAHMAVYAAAKSAVARLTESMADELRGDGISVFCAMPDVIDTPANRRDMPDADTSAWTPPDAIARLMVLLADPAAALLSGASLPLRGKPVV